MPPSSTFLRQRLPFPFPSTECHSGIPLSNGTFGALVWGEGRTVRLTLNRADYWDHRGGLEFGEEATYANLRAWLEAGDEERLREVFEGAGSGRPGTPPHPTRLPMGRVDLQLEHDWSLAGGGLHLHSGEAELELEGRREQGKLRAAILRDTPVLCLRITGVPGESVRVQARPPDAPEVIAYSRTYGLPKAQTFDLGEFGGWVQECPGEPAMCVAWLRLPSAGGLLLYVTSVYGDDPAAARRQALEVLEKVRAVGYTPATLQSFQWWGRWWAEAAEVQLSDPTAELLYYLGMYKLAGLSVPGGPAATLQGPWVEEHRMPPWSGDYHFNVNVQECYWPCFAGNHPEALLPLVQMLGSWVERLQGNAQRFVGVTDGFQLPHATDDRGTAMTGFWTGFVDHGATAWTAQLFWLYYRFTLDREFLQRAAYPFMKGALRVYEAMLEEDGRHLALPVSVSPEFGGAGVEAWGRNASYQLAMIHFLCRALQEGAAVLGLDAEECGRWAEIEARLPLGAFGGSGDEPELLIWDGQPLSESHRHHSHLAGIYPLDIFDPYGNEAHRRLVHHSLRRLTLRGTGEWTGWCVPWAAILHARLGNGEMAALLLETFRRAFMGPGYASTHDARFGGFTVIDGRPAMMQVEAGEGAAAAVLEMLLHTAGGVLRVFPAVPAAWETAAFARVRAEGAFLVSAERENGATVRVTVHSEAGAPLRIANPWGDSPVAVRREGGAPQFVRGRVLELVTNSGETLELTPTAKR